MPTYGPAAPEKPTFQRATIRMNDGGVYGGALPTAYSDPIGDPYMRWDRDSKNDRSQENIIEQGKLDSITDYIKKQDDSFSLSKGSTQRWEPSYDRNQDKRQQEDLWQQGTISDIEKWVGDFVSNKASQQPDPNRIRTISQDGTVNDPKGTNPYADLTFQPKAAYNPEKLESEHTNEGQRRNLADAARISNIQDTLSAYDAARAPEIASQKALLSDTYGAAIDETYNRLFETDTGIDAAGKRYWTEDLLQNRAGLQEGDSYTNWLESAFKNTNDYKDFQVGKGPKVLGGLDDLPVVPGLPDDKVPAWTPSDYTPPSPVTHNYYGGGGGSSTPDYSNLFKEQDDAWSKKFDALTTTYQDQMNDIKSVFEESNRNNAELLKGYRDSQASYQKELKAEAAYGERSANQEVKGVKTKNELPGFQPKFKGTRGHFNRTGSRLKTGALNIA